MKILFPQQAKLYIPLFLILFFICGLVSFLTFSYFSYKKVVVHSNSVSTAVPTSSPEPHIDVFNQNKPYSLLVLGYGGGGHEGGKLTDSILLIHIVPENKKIFLISIPRDLWVSLPTQADKETYWKVNAAYPIGLDDRTYRNKPAQYTGEAGGGELAKYAIAKITGLPITHFVSLDFSAFEKTVNILRGIDVKVEQSFTDELYPNEEKQADSCGYSPEQIAAITATMSATAIEREKVFGCRYETIHFEKGVTHMDGQTALKYVRSRHSKESGGDFNRAARQRSVILAIKEKVLTLSFFPKIIPFISTLSSNVKTDMPLSRMEEFLHYKDDLTTYEIKGIALTDKDILKQSISQNGQGILIPKTGQDDWDSIKLWISEKMKE